MSDHAEFSPGGSSYASVDASRALTVVRINSTIVKRGFWAKIRGLAVNAPFAEDALALWFCAFDRETPQATKALVLAALAFFVVPKRFRPRGIAGVKLTDDAAVISAALAALGRAIQPRHRDRARRTLDSMDHPPT